MFQPAECGKTTSLPLMVSSSSWIVQTNRDWLNQKQSLTWVAATFHFEIKQLHLHIKWYLVLKLARLVYHRKCWLRKHFWNITSKNGVLLLLSRVGVASCSVLLLAGCRCFKVLEMSFTVLNTAARELLQCSATRFIKPLLSWVHTLWKRKYVTNIMSYFFLAWVTRTHSVLMVQAGLSLCPFIVGVFMQNSVIFPQLLCRGAGWGCKKTKYSHLYNCSTKTYKDSQQWGRQRRDTAVCSCAGQERVHVLWHVACLGEGSKFLYREGRVESPEEWASQEFSWIKLKRIKKTFLFCLFVSCILTRGQAACPVQACFAYAKYAGFAAFDPEVW